MPRPQDGQDSPSTGHTQVNLPLCFQGKPVKGQGGAGEAPCPLQRCGSVAPPRPLRRYTAQGTLPGQHFSQIHLMSAPSITQEYKLEVIFSKVISILHSVKKALSCYRLKCIRLVDRFQRIVLPASGYPSYKTFVQSGLVHIFLDRILGHT